MPTTTVGYVLLVQAVMRKRHIVVVELSRSEYHDVAAGVSNLTVVG